MKKLLLLLTIVTIISCNNFEKKPIPETPTAAKRIAKKVENERYFSLERVAELKKRCVEKGDKEAFGNLVDHYGNTRFENYELLPLAIIMADKYDYDIARSTIYFTFLDIENKGRKEKDFFKLDKNKQDFILKYLLDGAKNKNPGCLGILHGLFENGLNIEEGQKLEIEANYKNLR